MSIPSKYAENQFLVTTTGRFPLMGQLLTDALPRAKAQTAGLPEFTAVMANLTAAAAAWEDGEIAITNAEAKMISLTLSVDDKLAALTRKPDIDTPSLLETWETTIRNQVAYRGPTYITLLPYGRRTLTRGGAEERIDALLGFSQRLAQQAAKPALVALGADVAAFHATLRALRDAQNHAKAALFTARNAQEPRRLTAAAALYALVGQGMVVWSAEPERVDRLFSVHLMRTPGGRRRRITKLAISQPG